MEQKNIFSNDESEKKSKDNEQAHKEKFKHWEVNERELYERIQAQIEKDDFIADIALNKGLLHSEIPIKRGGEIYLAVRDLYEDKLLRLKKENAIDSRISKTKRTIKLLEMTVVLYCKTKLMEELSQFDLPSARMHLKKLEREVSFDGLGEFISKSIKLAFASIEAEIELEKETADLRKQLGLTKPQDDKDNEANEYKKIKNPEFTTTRQVLALRYLLAFAKAKDKKPNASKKFIHFLTSKDQSSIGKKFDDEGLAYNKDGEDLSFVRKQFEDLGLTEILRMIDNDKT